MRATKENIKDATKNGASGHEVGVASKLIHRQPNEGRTRRFRRRLTFLNILVKDSVIGTIQALKTIMVDRVKWKKTHRNTLFFSSQLFMTCVKETVANNQQDELKILL